VVGESSCRKCRQSPAARTGPVAGTYSHAVVVPEGASMVGSEAGSIVLPPTCVVRGGPSI